MGRQKVTELRKEYEKESKKERKEAQNANLTSNKVQTEEREEKNGGGGVKNRNKEKVTVHRRETTEIKNIKNSKVIKETTQGIKGDKNDKSKVKMTINHKTVVESHCFAGLPPGFADPTHPKGLPKPNLGRSELGRTRLTARTRGMNS